MRRPFHLRTTFTTATRKRVPSCISRRREPEFAMTVSATSAPTATTFRSTSPSSSSLNSADFLKLLTSELQNQNPLNATSTTDFINQLTSYANFSEQQSINSSMSSLASSFASLVTLNSVNYIGHTVEAKTDTATLSN